MMMNSIIFFEALQRKILWDNSTLVKKYGMILLFAFVKQILGEDSLCKLYANIYANQFKV